VQCASAKYNKTHRPDDQVVGAMPFLAACSPDYRNGKDVASRI
jgi:hypothetical protein